MYGYSPSIAQKLDSQSVLTISACQVVTYQFQVVEYIKDDKVMKVELQAQATTHDNTGNAIHSSGFIPIPRIQLPYVEHSK
jgi:hypothetical protein